MEPLLKIRRQENVNVADDMINSAMVDKIADIVAQVLANKNEMCQRSSLPVTSITRDTVLHHLPRQKSLPALSLPYIPRTPAKESYTLEDFQCKYCQRPFFSKRELSKHTESVHFAEVFKPSYWCSICMTSFSSNKELTSHMQSYHNEMLQDGGNSCKLCFQKFHHPCLLSNHMTTYHVPLTECHHCSKNFSGVMHLWSHLMCEHKVQPKEVQCNLCAATFGSPDDYENHHKSEHAFPCAFCETSVKTKDDLRAHTEIQHQKQLCEDCFETFDDSESYVQHFVSSEGCTIYSESLVCSYCRLKFSKIKLLYRHHCLDTFTCVVCSAKIISCKKYQEHLGHVHHTKVCYAEVDPKTVEYKSPPKSATTTSPTQHRLIPKIYYEPAENSELFTNSDLSYGKGSTVNYIHNLIQVNESLLNSKPVILSNYPSHSSMDSPSNQASDLLKLCNTDELMKYIHAHVGGFKSLLTNSPPELVKDVLPEQVEMDTTDVTKLNNGSKFHPLRRISSEPATTTISIPENSAEQVDIENSHPVKHFELEDDENKGDVSDRDDAPAPDPEHNLESRRDSLRQKYQQLSITRKQRRSSKTHLNKILQKTKFDDVCEPFSGGPWSSFQCQRCSKTFATRSILSRHWATATRCYICSMSMCDLKVLNEHMKSDHSEYTD